MILVTLDLVEDFKTGLYLIRRKMNALKKSIEPYSTYYLVQLTLILPTILARILTNFLAEKMSCVFSNVPGPKTPFIFT